MAMVQYARLREAAADMSTQGRCRTPLSLLNSLQPKRHHGAPRDPRKLKFDLRQADTVHELKRVGPQVLKKVGLYQDAMAMVRVLGMPSLFITMGNGRV